MIERKCAFCGKTIHIDENNSEKAIRFKGSFYHYNCFREHCNIKMQSKKCEKRWTEIAKQIDQLCEDTTKEQRESVFKDRIFQWMTSRYGLSCVSKNLFMKLAAVYDGSYNGLAYPISAEELFNEWQFYFKDLCFVRRNKGIVGEQAINYDLAILLKKNAEYRSQKEKEKVAQAVRELQQREETVVNLGAITKRQSKPKVADLYKELNGGEE